MDAKIHTPDGATAPFMPLPSESARQFFARLTMRGGSRAVLEQWARVPVETYFVALLMPVRALNTGGRSCSETVEPLSSLFASIKWE